MFGQSLLSAFGSTACTTNDLNYPITNLAYYKMSNATDQLGNYNGTATNVNFNVAGKFGNAGEFNGSSSEINLGTSSNFSITTTGALSGSMWVKTTDTSASYLISKANDASGNYEWAIEYGYPTGKMKLNVYNTAAGFAASVTNNTTINDGNWHHLAFVIVNNTSVSLYIDGGTPATSTSWSGTAGSFSIPTLIGHFGGISAPTSWWNGTIDQVRIFSSALNASEVTQLYDEIYCVPTIVPTDYFNPVLYTGNGGTQSVTGVGFKPDLVWVKARQAGISHILIDSVRGVSRQLASNASEQEYFNSGKQTTAFNADGFTVVDQTNGGFGVNGAPGQTYSGTNAYYVSWNWKAGGAAVSNTDGTITSQVSANVDAGFSIISYTGASGTVGHGLDSTPEIIIQKKTNGTEDWYVYFPPGVINSNYNYMVLNTSNTGIGTTGSTPPTTTTFNPVSNSGNYIAYAFHSIAGYSKIGTYTGTSVANHSIVTGFKPAWVMIKNTNSGYSWIITDDKRTTDKILYANLSQGEDTTSNGITSFDSNGFTLGTAVSFNQNTNVYIFMAFAE